MFHSFLSDNSKQDSSLATAHSKSLISLLKDKTLFTTSLITVWGNTGGCDEEYICASALYLMLVMSQCYSVIIDRGISAPGHGKEVVDGLNSGDKSYLYQLMSNVQITGSKIFDS